MPLDRRDAALVALAIALPSLALVGRLPAQPLILGVLNDFAHAPVFGAFAVIVFLLLHRHAGLASAWSHALALAIAVATGGVVELIQTQIGRAAQWRDLQTDALGALVGLSLFAAVATRRLIPRVTLVVAAMVAALPTILPVVRAVQGYVARSAGLPTLISAGMNRYFLRTRAIELSLAQLPPDWRRADDTQAFRVRTLEGRWPGITHLEPPPIWTGHKRLLLDLTNPGTRPLELTLRVHDSLHDNRAADRFSRKIALPPRKRLVLEIPLSEIVDAPEGRPLDISQVAGLILYSNGEATGGGREYYISRIWLD